MSLDTLKYHHIKILLEILSPTTQLIAIYPIQFIIIKIKNTIQSCLVPLNESKTTKQ